MKFWMIVYDDQNKKDENQRNEHFCFCKNCKQENHCKESFSKLRILEQKHWSPKLNYKKSDVPNDSQHSINSDRKLIHILES